MELELHSPRKQVLFVESNAFLKLILDEREACVTLPNITVLKTAGSNSFLGRRTHRNFNFNLRPEGVILAPNFLPNCIFWDPVFEPEFMQVTVKIYTIFEIIERNISIF